jgi:hypothetical protein
MAPVARTVCAAWSPSVVRRVHRLPPAPGRTRASLCVPAAMSPVDELDKSRRHIGRLRHAPGWCAVHSIRSRVMWPL